MHRLSVRGVPLAATLALSLLFVSHGGPAAAAPPPHVYAALGDSFTSAPLVPLPTGEPIDCGRSTRNYPQLVRAAIRPAAFQDISCGGASTDDMAEPQDGLPFGGTNPPQFSALRPDTTLVTIGIGGNDIGFSTAVKRCVQFLPVALGGKPCTPGLTANGVDYLGTRIAKAAPRIATVLQQIQAQSPLASVLIVGYPAILPHSGNGCWPYVPVLPDDVPYLRAKTIELNAMLATQAAANGATFVDVYTPSIGHDACQLPGFAWVNGMVIVPLSFPAHPNELGEAGMARAVQASMRAAGLA